MANALRPSNPLKNKSNIHAVGNRYQEATAEDFVELGQILDDHATKLDAVTGAPDQNPNYGVYTSLSLLSATHPTAVAGAYAVIDPGTGSDPQIALWDDTDDEWVLQVNYPTNAISTDVGQSLIYGSDNKPYFHETILFKGTYVDLVALQTAHPTADAGSYAYVDAGIGEDVQAYIWDDDDDGWVLQGSASGPAIWGGITGTLSDQTDLQVALAGKVNIAGDQTINAIKTFDGAINANPSFLENPTYNRRYVLLWWNGYPFICQQKEIWTGSSWSGSGSGIQIGQNAGLNAKCRYNVIIGQSAGTNAIGDGLVAIGANAMLNHDGINAVGVGFSAGMDSIAANGVYLGGYAGIRNLGGVSVLLGYYAGGDNIAAKLIGIGINAARFNEGQDVNIIGSYAGTYNKGEYNNGIGGLIFSRAVGKQNQGMGFEVLQYSEGINNTVIGHQSFNSFNENVGSAKNFSPSDVTVGTSTITVTSHGFGSSSTWVVLRFTTTGAGLSTGVTSGTVLLIYIVDANTLKIPYQVLTSQGTGTHTFTAQFKYNNVNILGAALQPTRSNQTILGGLSAVLPNSTIAEAQAVGGKAVVTQEFLAEQRVFGDIEVDAAVTGTKNIAVNSYASFRYSLTGTTTLTESGTPASGKSCVRTFIITGNQTLNLPASWATNKVGTYDGAKRNLFTVSYMNVGGTLEVDVIITQMN